MFGVSVTVIDLCGVRQGTIMRSASVVCLPDVPPQFFHLVGVKATLWARQRNGKTVTASRASFVFMLPQPNLP